MADPKLPPEVEAKLAEIAKSMPVLAEAFREIALLAAGSGK